MVMAIASSVYAQEKPYTQPGLALPVPPPPPPKVDSAAAATAAGSTTQSAPAAPTGTAAPAPEQSGFERFVHTRIPDAIAKGKFSLNARLRYEYVKQEGTPAITDESHAPTIRTRFGYATAPLYGFQAMAEAENVSVIGNYRNYNAAGVNGVPYKPVVADPRTTEINQAWLSYNYTNWITLKGGRQRIALDNHRFIGDVGWRQNMQTYDAATLQSQPLPDLNLFYGFAWDVNRVFGDVDGLAFANRDFKSDSHMFNISYSGCKYGRLVGYTYLLDLENEAGNAASSATYGAYWAGATPITDDVSLGYHAEFAWQTDYADSPLDYGAEYYNVELSGNTKPVSVGAGYEVLGSDDTDSGFASFRTPLATAHAFNGWADVFLTTPAVGLRDAYGFVQLNLPANVPVRFIYHKFDSDEDNVDLGQEFNVVASRKFGKHWTALAKYAYYDGKEAPARIDAHKFWAQMEFNF